MMSRLLISCCIGLFLVACGGDIQPKPKAFLRLDYPEAQYDTLKEEIPFSFEKNTYAKVSKKEGYNLNLDYPAMKATIYITYKPVKDNLVKLLKDAQNLTYEHTIKATNIVEQPYLNTQDKVYGMFYEVDGNAASQSQFYITDSTRHFITGSIYFRVRPNYDSIYPAAIYLKKDIRRIMETAYWK